jgi:hypothetical protein
MFVVASGQADMAEAIIDRAISAAGGVLGRQAVPRIS